MSLATCCCGLLVLPHLTVGRFAYGGGRIVQPESPELSESWDVRWSVCGPSVPNPDFGGSPTWSRDELFCAPMSRLARSLSRSKWYLERTRRPVAARVIFDYARKRFVLAGGPALALYRDVQARVVQ